MRTTHPAWAGHGWDPELPPSHCVRGWCPAVLLQHPFRILSPKPVTFHLPQRGGREGALQCPGMETGPGGSLSPMPKPDPLSQDRVIAYTKRPDGKAQVMCLPVSEKKKTKTNPKKQPKTKLAEQRERTTWAHAPTHQNTAGWSYF